MRTLHVGIWVEGLKRSLAFWTGPGYEVPGTVSPGGSEDFWTAWVTDPDGYRIELVQWPTGHAEGMTAGDLAG